MSDPEGKWLINENDVEVVVSLGKDYYRIKDSAKVETDR